MQDNRSKGMVQAQSSFTSLMGSQTMLAPTNLVVAVMREVRESMPSRSMVALQGVSG